MSAFPACDLLSLTINHWKALPPDEKCGGKAHEAVSESESSNAEKEAFQKNGSRLKSLAKLKPSDGSHFLWPISCSK